MAFTGSCVGLVVLVSLAGASFDEENAKAEIETNFQALLDSFNIKSFADIVDYLTPDGIWLTPNMDVLVKYRNGTLSDEIADSCSGLSNGGSDHFVIAANGSNLFFKAFEDANVVRTVFYIDSDNKAGVVLSKWKVLLFVVMEGNGYKFDAVDYSRRSN